jgi:hypothetical protein
VDVVMVKSCLSIQLSLDIPASLITYLKCFAQHTQTPSH